MCACSMANCIWYHTPPADRPGMLPNRVGGAIEARCPKASLARREDHVLYVTDRTQIGRYCTTVAASGVFSRAETRASRT